MNIKGWHGCVIIAFLAAPVAFAQVPMVVKTRSGLVSGTGVDVRGWKGIRYAKPPIGDWRWRPPQPAPTWQGIRQTLQFGPMCPQSDATRLRPGMSEDCLNLNVWSGAKAGQRLPVFVWIHGGGFVGGSNRIDGEPLARLGIVVVSINYRLGVFGFLAHPDLTRESPHHASGNYGLMDQIAALRWVQENIAAFGGDPHRVTIGGVSAGGTSVGYLLASPLAKGLFQGAMLDSASRLFLPDPGLSETLHGLTPMEQVGLQIAPHIKDLRALTTPEVMTRAARVTDELYAQGGSGRLGLRPESRVHMPDRHDSPWWAFTDGYVMPEELSRMFSSGRFNHVACMVGTCRNEGMSFTRELPSFTSNAYHDYLRRYYPTISMKMFAMYSATTPEEIRAAITRTITDFMFIYGSIRVADDESASGEPVYVDRFTRVPPGAPGALHGSDQGYFRGDVKTGIAAGLAKYDADDEKLSAEMMHRLAAFVKTFDPNYDHASPHWPAWAPARSQYMEFGDQIHVRDFQDQAIINLYREQLGQ